MFNTKQSLKFASLLLYLSLLPSYSAIAQTTAGEFTNDSEGTEVLNVPGDAERLGVQEVDIRDYQFEQQAQPQQIQTQPRQLDIGLQRELDVKLVPPPDRQNTVYDNTSGVQVQIIPGKPKKEKPEF